jgi:hypothetical protein
LVTSIDRDPAYQIQGVLRVTECCFYRSGGSPGGLFSGERTENQNPINAPITSAMIAAAIRNFHRHTSNRSFSELRARRKE